MEANTTFLYIFKGVDLSSYYRKTIWNSNNTIGVAESLVVCVVFCISCFVFLSFFFWPLYYLSFCILAIVLSVLLSFGHCIICPSVFWPLYYLSFCLLAIVLSVLLRFTTSNYTFGIIKHFLRSRDVMLVLCLTFILQTYA
jgi:hypothetical protein